MSQVCKSAKRLHQDVSVQNTHRTSAGSTVDRSDEVRALREFDEAGPVFQSSYSGAVLKPGAQSQLLRVASVLKHVVHRTMHEGKVVRSRAVVGKDVTDAGLQVHSDALASKVRGLRRFQSGTHRSLGLQACTPALRLRGVDAAIDGKVPVSIMASLKITLRPEVYFVLA